MAAPPRAAATIGVALSLHEKALRSPLPRLDVELDDERLEARLWVRVGINSSLPGCRLNGQGRVDVPAPDALNAPVSAAAIEPRVGSAPARMKQALSH